MSPLIDEKINDQSSVSSNLAVNFGSYGKKDQRMPLREMQIHHMNLMLFIHLVYLCCEFYHIFVKFVFLFANILIVFIVFVLHRHLLLYGIVLAYALYQKISAWISKKVLLISV